MTEATFYHDDEYLRSYWEDLEKTDVLRVKDQSSYTTLVRPLLIPDVRIAVSGPDNWVPSFPTLDAIRERTFWLLPIPDAERAWCGLILLLSGSGIRGEYHRLGAFSSRKKRNG